MRRYGKPNRIAAYMQTKDEPPPLEDVTVFRGFVGGDAFITKKGFKGLKVDCMWARNLFISFETDDAELAAIALQSSLANIHAKVEGNPFGAPLSIGGYGFYARHQCLDHAAYLKQTARATLPANYYLSDKEWMAVDKKLDSAAQYAQISFEYATQGDSFIHLAVKKNAFQVAACLLYHHIDPIEENEDGHDLMQILQQQYQALTTEMKDLRLKFVECLSRTTLRTEFEPLEAQESKLLSGLQGLIDFCPKFLVCLQQRLTQLEAELAKKRPWELLDADVDPVRLVTIAQRDKVLRYLQEVKDLESYAEEKHSLYSRQQISRQALLASVRHLEVNRNVKALLSIYDMNLDYAREALPSLALMPLSSTASAADSSVKSIDDFSSALGMEPEFAAAPGDLSNAQLNESSKQNKALVAAGIQVIGAGRLEGHNPSGTSKDLFRQAVRTSTLAGKFAGRAKGGDGAVVVYK